MKRKALALILAVAMVMTSFTAYSVSAAEEEGETVVTAAEETEESDLPAIETDEQGENDEGSAAPAENDTADVRSEDEAALQEDTSAAPVSEGTDENSSAAEEATDTDESSPADPESTAPESTPADSESAVPESTPADSEGAAPESTPAESESAETESTPSDAESAETDSTAADAESDQEESKTEESEQSEETLLEGMEITEVSIAEGYYRIASLLDTSFVLDIYGGRVKDATNVDLYTSNNSPAQVFKITPVTVDGKKRYTIRPVSCMSMGLAANAASMEGKAQANVLQKTASDTDAQLWYFSKGSNGGYRIHNNLSDKHTMQVYGGTAKDAANVHIYKINNKIEQEWKLTKVGGGSVAEGLYTIRYMKTTGKVLDIYGNQLTNNANVQVYKANGSAAQKFWVETANEKYRRIRGYASGMSMDVNNASYQNGTNIQLYKTKNATAQKYLLENTGAKVGGKAVIFIKTLKGPYYVEVSGTNVQLGSSGGYWLFEKTSETQILKDGIYSIRTELKDTMAVDIYGGRVTAGTKADIYKWNASNAQKFQVKYSSGKTTMMALQSGMYLTNTGGTVANKNRLTQQKSSGTAAQWKLVPTGDGKGSFYIQYAANTKYQIDVAGGKTANLTALQLYQGNDSTAQKFIFKKTSIATGWQNYLGKYRYLYNTKGDYYTNMIFDGYIIDRDGNGVKSEKSQRIQKAIDSVYNANGKDLYQCFAWVVNNLTYNADATYSLPSGWTMPEYCGVLGIENKSGFCSYYAGAFYLLAKGLGYDAHFVSGYVPQTDGTNAEHDWVEIDIDGGTYVFDCNFRQQYGTGGWYFTYGSSGTWKYINYSRLN